MFTTIVLGLLLSHVSGKAGVAADRNLTALNTQIAPSWVPDPDNRGTWSLLYSCVFTLVLCVWTAIHPNIPAQGESQARQFCRKMGWVLAAILAPEFGAFTAWQQWCWSRRLCSELNTYRSAKGGKILRDLESAETAEKTKSPKPVSLTYGFFAVMGGFAVDVSDIHDHLARATLTHAGILFLAEKGHFFDVSDDDIRDKSKADYLAKGLVIVQVAYIFLQCVSRKAVGLPLTPLEVHTLVHAGCAVFMYALWFYKPFDVRAPMVVPSEDFQDWIALMLMRSPAIGRTLYDELDPPKDYVPLTYVPGLSEVLALLQERRAEVSYLMFDQGSRPDEPQRDANIDSTYVALEVAQDGNSTTVNLDDDSQDSNIASTMSTTSSVKGDHKPIDPQLTEAASAFNCTPSPENRTVISLTSGNTTASGIAPCAFVTGASRHEWEQQPSAKALWFWKHRLFDAHPKEPPTPIEVTESLRLADFVYVPGLRWLRDSWHFDSANTARNNLDRNSRGVRPTSNSQELSGVIHWHRLRLSLSKKDCLRWERAGSAFKQETEQTRTSLRESTPPKIALNTEHRTNFISLCKQNEKLGNCYLMDRCRNIRGTDVLRVLETSIEINRESTVMLLAIFTLMLLYSASHLALWNNQFPTRTEKIMWRISGIALASVPGLFLGLTIAIFALVILYVFRESWLKQKERHRRVTSRESKETGLSAMAATWETPEYPSVTYWTFVWLREKFQSLLHAMWVTIVGVSVFVFVPVYLGVIFAFCILYPFGRVFIVVESFISLRHVPVGVYEGVGWAQYIPHL